MGSNKLMHTVIAPYCTGCELCIPVCPVDCISLENVTGERTGWSAWSAADAAQALDRYAFHSYRRTRSKGARPETPESDGLAQDPSAAAAGIPTPADRKRSIIEAALASAKARQSG